MGERAFKVGPGQRVVEMIEVDRHPSRRSMHPGVVGCGGQVDWSGGFYQGTAGVGNIKRTNLNGVHIWGARQGAKANDPHVRTEIVQRLNSAVNRWPVRQ